MTMWVFIDTVPFRHLRRRLEAAGVSEHEEGQTSCNVSLQLYLCEAQQLLVGDLQVFPAQL